MSIDWGNSVATDNQTNQDQLVAQSQQNQANGQATPQAAAGATTLVKQYPWLTGNQVAALTQYQQLHGNDPDFVKLVGQLQAASKFATAGSGILDRTTARITGGAARGIHDVGGAVSAVNSALGSVVPGLSAVETGIGYAGRAAGIAVSALAPVPQNIIREGLRQFEATGGPLGTGEAPKGDPFANVARQTPAAQAVKQLVTDPSNVDIGTGFQVGGTAAADAVAAQKATASIDGHAFTLGRGVASTLNQLSGKRLFQPGTDAYQFLSGSIDAGAAWELDPGANALREAHGIAEARSSLATPVAEAVVTKAAEKAPDAYAQAWKDVALVDGGTRNTVIPASVDHFLLDPRGQKLVNNLAGDSSPYSIWVKLGRPDNTEIPFQVAQTSDVKDVLGILRSPGGMGVGVNPAADGIAGVGARVTQTLQNHFRAFNIMPDTMLDPSDPQTFMKNLENSLANGKVLGAERTKVMDEAFKFMHEDGAVGPNYFQLINLGKQAVEDSIANVTGDRALAKSLTSYSGATGAEGERVTRYMMQPDGTQVNLPYLKDAEGNPLLTPMPASLHEAMAYSVPLYDPAKVNEIRTMTSKLNPIFNSLGWTIPRTILDVETQELFKGLNTLRPAMAVKVLSDHTLRLIAEGSFDSPLDYLMFAAGKRGATMMDGGYFDLAKEYDALNETLLTAEGPAREAAVTRLNEINDMANEELDKYTQSLIGSANQYDEASLGRKLSQTARDRQYTVGTWGVAEKNAHPDSWVSGVGDDLMAEHTDAINVRVANGGLLPGDAVDGVARPGIDGIKDWLLNGAGQKYREQLDRMYPGYDHTNESILDQYLQTQEDRIKWLTGENPDLKQAIVTGLLDGGTDAGSWVKVSDTVEDPVTGQVSKPAEYGRVVSVDNGVAKVRVGGEVRDIPAENLKAGSSPVGENVTKGRAPLTESMRARLEDYRANDPTAPQLTKYHMEIGRDPNLRTRGFYEAAKLRDAVTGWAFSHMIGAPQDALMNSPLHKATWWNSIEKMMPWMDSESHASVLADAATANLGEARTARLVEAAKAAGPDAQLSYAEASRVASGRAADAVKDLFYTSAGDRSQAFNILRNAMPYGDVWANVLKTWGKLVVENPTIARRAQMIVTGANGSGFAHPDPTTGQEMFSYPLPSIVASTLGVNFKANIAGLSLGTSATPGLSPTASVLASELMPRSSKTWDPILNLLLPYGRPDTSSYMATVNAATNPIPSAWGKLGEAVFGDKQNDRNLWNTWMETFSAQVASGKVTQDPQGEGVQQALKSSLTTARYILGLRGLIQLVAPASPTVAYNVATKGGDEVSTVLAQKFAELRQQQNEGKIPDAIAAFTQQYGDFVYVYMVGKTKSEVGGLGASTQFGDWEAQHGDLISKYPTVAGYLGPQVAGYDPLVTAAQENAGERTRRTPAQRLADGQQLIGDYYVRQAKAQLPIGTLTQEQTDWLNQVKAKVTQEFPKWDPNYQGSKRPQEVAQLQTAVNDPNEDVGHTPVGQAAKTYFQYRDEAVAAAKARGVTGWQTANSTVDLRAWLRSAGEKLAQIHPEFKTVWQDVLDGEMKDDNSGTKVAK